jgi:phosphoglucosamine mutase
MPDAGFTPPRFGTDGLRGRYGEPPMDQDTLRRVAAALGVWLQQSGPEQKRVLLGHDGRRSAPAIMQTLTDGLAAADVASIDLGLVTTPALAFLTRTEGVAAGIMVSASHNPAADNGIKIFSADGAKLADQAERAIEALSLHAEFAGVRARAQPRSTLVQRYEEHLRRSFPNLDLAGVRLVLDAANGGGSELAPRVLRLFGAEVFAVGCAPDGDNINAGVGALHPEQAAQAVVRERAAFGICLDGDGDRGIFIDDRGSIHDGDAVLAVLARDLHARGELPGATVVATVMSNLGLERLLAHDGIHVLKTPVGDRHVVQAMRDRGFALGGEQSGHIVFAGPGHFTGDGLFTALALLALPGARKGLAARFADYRRYPQVLLNVAVARKPDLTTLPAVAGAVETAERDLGADGRVVLRYSGTEDLCRVMVEGPAIDQVRVHAERIASAVRSSLT